MPDAPFISGSDILSNPGNPALGYSGTGVEYNANPADMNPLANVQGTLARLQEEDAKMRFQKHLEARDDQEKLAQFISGLNSRGGSLANMKGPDGENNSLPLLPQDQQVMDEAALKLNRGSIKDPHGYRYNAEFQQKFRDYQTLLKHAQFRSAIEMKNRVAASASLNPEDQNGYLRTNQTEIIDKDVRDLYRPNVYIPVPELDPEIIIPSKVIQDKNNQTNFTLKDANGNPVDGWGLKNDVADVGARIVPGTPAWRSAIAYSANFIKGAAKDPGLAIELERRNAINNANRGLKPGDPNYVPPITQLQPDGTVKFLTTKPNEIARAIMYETNGAIQATPLTDEMRQKRLESAQKQRHTLSEESMELRKQAETERHNLATEGDKQKPITTAGLKEIETKNAAQAAVKATNSVFKQPIPNTTATHPDFWNNRGIDPTEFNIVEIKDKSANAMLGIEEAAVKDKKPSGQTVKPGRTFLLENKQTGKKELVFLGNDAARNVIARVNQNDASVNVLKHNSKYQPSIYSDQSTWVNHYLENGTEAPATTTPSQVSRPATVPPAAIFNEGKKIWIDKKARKAYDENGQEIKRGQ